MGTGSKPDEGKACATIGTYQRHTSFFYIAILQK